MFWKISDCLFTNSNSPKRLNIINWKFAYWRFCQEDTERWMKRPACKWNIREIFTKTLQNQISLIFVSSNSVLSCRQYVTVVCGQTHHRSSAEGLIFVIFWPTHTLIDLHSSHWLILPPVRSWSPSWGDSRPRRRDRTRAGTRKRKLETWL